MSYSNTSNPWGDSNLSEKFDWKLKNEREREMGVDPHKRAKDQELTNRELEKAKKRRVERESEKKRWEEERRTQRDPGENYDWERKEEEFLLQQAKLRAEIRLKEGRGKPIDVLYKNLSGDTKFGVQVESPHAILVGMALEELEELKKDIQMYRGMDVEHVAFWEALLVVCDHEIERAKAESGEVVQGVHKAILGDVTAILGGKTYQQLETLQKQIIAKLEGGGAVDTEYWEGLLSKLVVFKAKAKLDEIHSQIVKGHKVESSEGSSGVPTPAPVVAARPVAKPKSEPEPMDPAEIRRRQLEKEIQRLKERSGGVKTYERMMTAEEMVQREADYGKTADGEEPFNTDATLAPREYTWVDKYTPKKPKFYNRVSTGFEWNKYNQTHYDEDNPPPKIVMGYKFNIFFPELVDMKKTPTFFLEKADNPDFVHLVFRSGPPYEDIGFKIVNKEWEYSHKKGFRCTFERGILHLHFQLKKYRYKR